MEEIEISPAPAIDLSAALSRHNGLFRSRALDPRETLPSALERSRGASARGHPNLSSVLSTLSRLPAAAPPPGAPPARPAAAFRCPFSQEKAETGGRCSAQRAGSGVTTCSDCGRSWHTACFLEFFSDGASDTDAGPIRCYVCRVRAFSPIVGPRLVHDEVASRAAEERALSAARQQQRVLETRTANEEEILRAAAASPSGAALPPPAWVVEAVKAAAASPAISESEKAIRERDALKKARDKETQLIRSLWSSAAALEKLMDARLHAVLDLVSKSGLNSSLLDDFREKALACRQVAESVVNERREARNLLMTYGSAAVAVIYKNAADAAKARAVDTVATATPPPTHGKRPREESLTRPPTPETWWQVCAHVPKDLEEAKRLADERLAEVHAIVGLSKEDLTQLILGGRGAS